MAAIAVDKAEGIIVELGDKTERAIFGVVNDDTHTCLDFDTSLVFHSVPFMGVHLPFLFPYPDG